MYAERLGVTEGRNTQFTERAVNDIGDTQEVQLGAYQDVAPVSQQEVTTEVKQDPLLDFNMEGYDLNYALSREYVVATIPWLQTQGTGTVLSTLQFPKLLFDQTFIKDKVQDFKYFKAGVRLTIRVTANKFLYGKLLVCYNPMPTLDTFDPSLIATATTIPHMLVSASASEAAVFDVPFIYNKRAIDLSSYGPTEIGHFKIFVLNALNSVTTDVDGGNIVVTAQFIDPVLHLPHDVTVQSKRGSEAHLKSVAGSISSRNQVTIPTRGQVTNTRRSVGRAFTRVLEGAATTVLAAAMMGLSKPTTLDTAQVVKVNPYSDTASGRGIDTSVKLAIDPENGICTDPCVGGISEDEMAFAAIVGTPSLCSIVTYLPASTPLPVAIIGPVGELYQTYVDLLTNQFYYWSGSYKFKAYITASLFHIVRGVFWLAENGSTTSWENCYHKVVDIQGDTEVDFMVPYLAQEFASNTSSGGEFAVYFRILSWSQPDSALSCPIHLNMYKSGDSDFQVFVPRETTFTTQSNPRRDFNQPFEPLHPSMTGYTHDSLVFGEKITTLRDLMHRYHAEIAAPNTGVLNVYDVPPTTGNTHLGLEKFGLMYRFRRGSVRIKLFYLDAAAPTRVAYLQYSNGAVIQGFTLSSSNNKLIEVEAPWYSNLLFDSTTAAPVQAYQLAYSGTSVAQAPFVSKAAGDDFSYHFLRLPNMVSAVTSSATTGQRGVRAQYVTA